MRGSYALLCYAMLCCAVYSYSVLWTMPSHAMPCWTAASASEVRAAHASGLVVACKLYPHGATTHSAQGVSLAPPAPSPSSDTDTDIDTDSGNE